jgi:hypothetical protein
LITMKKLSKFPLMLSMRGNLSGVGSQCKHVENHFRIASVSTSQNFQKNLKMLKQNSVFRLSCFMILTNQLGNPEILLYITLIKKMFQTKISERNRGKIIEICSNLVLI